MASPSGVLRTGPSDPSPLPPWAPLSVFPGSPSRRQQQSGCVPRDRGVEAGPLGLRELTRGRGKTLRPPRSIPGAFTLRGEGTGRKCKGCARPGPPRRRRGPGPVGSGSRARPGPRRVAPAGSALGSPRSGLCAPRGREVGPTALRPARAGPQRGAHCCTRRPSASRQSAGGFFQATGMVNNQVWVLGRFAPRPARPPADPLSERAAGSGNATSGSRSRAARGLQG